MKIGSIFEQEWIRGLQVGDKVCVSTAINKHTDVVKEILKSGRVRVGENLYGLDGKKYGHSNHYGVAKIEKYIGE